METAPQIGTHITLVHPAKLRVKEIESGFQNKFKEMQE